MNTSSRHEIETIRSAYARLINLDTDLFPFLDENSKAPADKLDAIKSEIRQNAVRNIRSLLRTYDGCHPDPLEKPLTCAKRIIFEGGREELSDGPTYYWIDPDTSMSDEDIAEIKEDETYRCRSPYDCCGQQFTYSMHASRTPAGIVFINRTGFDY